MTARRATRPIWVLCLLALAACDTLRSTAAPATIPTGASIDCGPIVDQALCQAAVAVAITAQLNPPPIAAASLRRPRAGDDCLARLLQPCDASSIIVVLQSGDTIQDVALIRSGTGWVRLDLVR